MHINIIDKSDCCGCTACESVCPKDAISMTCDNLGFRYPIVNENLCINCEKCIKVCKFGPNNTRFSNFDAPEVYAIRCKDEYELTKSQSGGAFYVLSEYILKNHGLIYGAIMSSDFTVFHTKADNRYDRNRMRGSKYVQSDLSGVFRDIKNELKNDKKVLFVGTPCQVSGLRSYIGEKNDSNLYTIDLVCHGVPSPKAWKDYLEYLENKYKGKVQKVSFRDKKFGWKNAKESYIINHKEVTTTSFLDLYFLHCLLRDCCSSCPFTNFNRIGDLTIGDFWGWDKKHKEYNDNKGISLLLINSEKGRFLFNNIKSEVYYIQSNLEDSKQNALSHPTAHNKLREQFLNEYSLHGFKYVIKKYTQEGWRLRWKTKIAKLLHY